MAPKIFLPTDKKRAEIRTFLSPISIFQLLKTLLTKRKQKR